MNTETFQSLLRRQPFQPLEVRMSDGTKHKIDHPRKAMQLKSSIILGSPESDDFEFLSLLHVADVKALPVADGGANGESR
jgi:hypothetical protein